LFLQRSPWLRTAKAQVYPSPGVECGNWDDCGSCATSSTCPGGGGSCTKTGCVRYSGGSCNTYCVPSCPSGYVEGTGAGQCTVGCTPCSNNKTCVPKGEELPTLTPTPTPTPTFTPPDGEDEDCSGISYNTVPDVVCAGEAFSVEMNRARATSCYGNWDNVGRRVDYGVCEVGVVLSKVDGTNPGGTWSYVPYPWGMSAGTHTFQKLVNWSSGDQCNCLCNSWQFEVFDCNKTCSITSPADGSTFVEGDDIPFSYSGNNPRPGSEWVRLNMKRQDTLEIPGFTDYFSVYYADFCPGVPVNEYFDYTLARCLTTDGVECFGSKTIIGGFPAGEYTSHCDLAAIPDKCSGSFTCDYKGCDPAVDCKCYDCTGAGWVECSPTDMVTFTVEPLLECTAYLNETEINLEQGMARALIAYVRDKANPETPILDAEIDKIEFSATTIEGTDPVVKLWDNLLNGGAGGFTSSYPVRNDFPPVDYSTEVKGENVGVANIYVEAFLNNGRKCDNFIDPTAATVAAPGPWFQTQAGDVHAEGSMASHTGGEIYSEIPSTCEPDPDCDPNFSLADEDTGLPGVVSFSPEGSADFGKGYCSADSTTHWLVQQSAYKGKEYGYDYFDKKIDSPQPLGGNPSISDLNVLNGFYKVEGNLTLPESTWNINNPDQKVIVLVSGDLTISRRIGVGTNNNFLGFIASGDIIIQPEVKDSGVNLALEGLFIADGIIRTVALGSKDDKFTGRGIFVGWAGVSFNRDREDDNSTEPAELFVFRPDLWFNSPQELWQADFTWQEIAP